MHNFVTEPGISELAIYMSISITIVSLIALTFLYATNRWRPAPKWYGYSTFMKIFVGLFTPVFIYGVFWINIAISLPHLFTVLFGETTIKTDEVTKVKSNSRRLCDFHLKVESIDAIFFRYCISNEIYNSLPDNKINTELIIKQSIFGYTVETINLKRYIR